MFCLYRSVGTQLHIRFVLCIYIYMRNAPGQCIHSWSVKDEIEINNRIDGFDMMNTWQTRERYVNRVGWRKGPSEYSLAGKFMLRKPRAACNKSSALNIHYKCNMKRRFSPVDLSWWRTKADRWCMIDPVEALSMGWISGWVNPKSR